MPDETFGEKTEAPTPRRRQEARERGQVAKSQDLNAAIILLAAFLAFFAFGDYIFENIVSIEKLIFGNLGEFKINPQNIQAYSRVGILFLLKTFLPLLLFVVVFALAVSFLQVGFVATFHPLIPDLNKINPITGLKRIFSIRGFARLIASILKMIVISVVLYVTIVGEIENLYLLMLKSVSEITSYLFSICFKLGVRVSLALLVLAIFDYMYQRWQHEKDLRMSKQEIKDELKRLEGDPKIKERRRALQRQIAMQRMMREVPKADVVITNPTELAIALKYESEMPAPKVVAKGAGYIAEKIRKIAALHSVPIVEKKPLVRTLYKLVEVGDFVPPEFYKAVAEIIAYVYRISKKNRNFGNTTSLNKFV